MSPRSRAVRSRRAISWLWLVAIVGGVALIRLYFDHPRLAKNSNPIVAVVYLGTGCVLVLWGVRALIGEAAALLYRRRLGPGRRYSVRMPREAFAYMLILAVLCLGALLGHSNMLMLVFGLTAGPFVLNGQMTLVILSRLRVTRKLPEWATVDENFSVTLRLVNQKRFLSSWMVVAEDSVQGPRELLQPAVLYTCVPARSQREAAYEIRPARRGVYEFGPVRVMSRFPLGLMERSFELGQIEQLIVYPRIGRLKPLWRQASDFGEVVAERVPTRARAGDDEFHRLRDYRSGDNPRDIHWRTTARRNQLMVREYRPIRRQNLLLVVDLWLPQTPQVADLERVELAVSFAATICVDQIEAGVESSVDLVVCGKNTAHASRPGRSIGGLLEELALAQPGPAPDLATALQTAQQASSVRERRVLITTRAADAVRQVIGPPAAGRTNGPDLDFEIIEADPQTLVDYFALGPLCPKAEAGMKLETVFQFSLYSMVALAGAMLAYGEEAFFPSGLTAILSLAALFLNERPYSLRIPALVSNLLALVVVVAVINEFRGERVDARLLAGAHFLVYVTWIVLFQAKDIRHYWWLCALSLLQVALGPLLTLSSGWYGILLVAYLVLAIWTLSVFTLYQGAIEFGAIAEGPPAGEGKPGTTSGGRLAVSADPLTTLKQAFSRDRRSTVQNSIHQDMPGRWIVPRFIVGVLGLSLSGLALGLALFLFVPRVWIGGGLRNLGEARGSSPAVTGFSDEVRLGQIGQILESTDRVMQVGLFDHFSEQPVDAESVARQLGLSAPLFRGNVLDEYRNGRWLSGNRAESSSTLESLPREPGMIRQEYTLEMRGSDILFAMPPVELAVLTPYQAVSFEVDSRVLYTQDEGRDIVKYVAYSNTAEPRRDSGRRTRQSRFAGKSVRTIERGRQLPPQGLDRLIAFARELTASENLAGGPDLSRDRKIATTLEAHLRNSGTYSYSLNMAVADPHSDPVEDFLFNRQRGHCEYFASALALMLRAVKVPSRLVTGFKGADPLASAGYYEVQQRHAHAWVEAFVDDHWIVLDPTPAARDDYVREVAARMGFWKTAGNSLSSLWSTYVVSLSLNRQQQTLYDPLQGSASNGWGSVRDVVTHVANAAGWIKDAFLSPERLFTPAGGVVILVLLALPFIVFTGGRRFWHNRRRLPLAGRRLRWIDRIMDWVTERLTGRARDPARIVVAFYEQFQMLVLAVGFTPRLDQTQREFARHLEEALTGRLAPAGLHRFPSELTELFYHVRFGDGSLEAAEVEGLDKQLERLREILQPGGWRRLSSSRLAEADSGQ